MRYGKLLIVACSVCMPSVGSEIAPSTEPPPKEVTTRSPSAQQTVSKCPVTLVTDGMYGDQDITVNLPPDGKIVFRPGGPGFVLADGSLSWKFGWARKRRGLLTIEGRRLDAHAAPLRASISDDGNWDDVGISTSLIFPTPGCWEVTGHVADAELTFVLLVELIGSRRVDRQ